MSLLGVVAAGVTGFFTAWNPQAMALAYSIASGVDAYRNQPDRIGPRLDDLRTQMSVYGNPIPFEYGTNRHAGTVIWPNILEAVEHEHSESAKGSGPEQKTFTYTMSFGVLVCEGPIAGIRRIWANKKLVYDVSATNEGATYDPDVGQIRIYLGTETQEVDPLIQATDGDSPAYLGYAYVVFEDYDVTEMNGRPPQFEFEVVKVGITEVPDMAVFGDSMPGFADANILGDVDIHGNIWMLSATGHAVTNEITGELEFDFESRKPQVQLYSGDTKELLWYYDVPPSSEIPEEGGDPVEVYPAGGSIVCCGNFAFVGRGFAGANGSAYVHGFCINVNDLTAFNFVDTCGHQESNNFFYFPAVPIPVIDKNKVFFAGNNGLSGGFALGFMPASIAGEGGEPDTDPIPDFTGDHSAWTVPVGWAESRGKDTPCATDPVEVSGVNITFPGEVYMSRAFENPNLVIAQGPASGGGSFISLVSGDRVTGFDLTAPGISSGVIPGGGSVMPTVVYDRENECAWAFGADGFGYNGKLYRVTDVGGSLNVVDTGFTMPHAPGESASSNVCGACLDERTGLLRLVVGGGFTDEPAYIQLFDPIAEEILESINLGVDFSGQVGLLVDKPDRSECIFINADAMVAIPYAPPLTPERVLLSDIVTDVCDRVDLSEDDIDVEELTDLVDGYPVARQMMARAALEPLQQAYYFDAVESDDKLKFVKRGSAVVTTIPADDRAAHEAGQEIPANLEIRRAFETELPVQVDVEYPDIDADHQIGNQYDRRITKDNRHKLNLQLAIVMPATKAKEVARVNLYDAWQVTTFRWTTTRKYAFLEPTDRVQLPTASANYLGRITNRRDHPNGIIEWEGRQDAVEVYTQSGADAITPPYSPQTVFEADDTLLALLDIPLMRDDDDNAGYYVAMGAEA